VAAMSGGLLVSGCVAGDRTSPGTVDAHANAAARKSKQ
jgi:hypothetical protein